MNRVLPTTAPVQVSTSAITGGWKQPLSAGVQCYMQLEVGTSNGFHCN